MLPIPRLKFLITAVFVCFFLSVEVQAAPLNDNFEDAIDISGTTGVVFSSTIDATEEVDEPNPAGLSVPQSSIWYKWTASSSGKIEITTTGSDYDTTLGIYTGGSVDQLILVAENDDYRGLQSGVFFTPIEGSVYYIIVGGFSGQQGTVQLNWLPYSRIIISGAISLPGTNPCQDDVYGGLALYSNGNQIAYDGFYIAQGELLSYPWSLDVPGNSENLILEITVEENPNIDESILLRMYYNTSETKGLRGNASIINSSSDQDLGGIVLAQGNIISGTVSLQSEDVFRETDIGVYVSWGTEWYEEASKYFTVSAGDRELNYSLAVPSDVTEYVLHYFGWNISDASYLDSGYYNTTQDGYCQIDAVVFSGGVDYPDKDFVLLKGETVTGNVILPGTMELESLGVTIGLFEDPEGEYDTTLIGYNRTTVSIAPGMSSAPYELTLPNSCSDNVAQYIVGYRQNNGNYVPIGYYSEAGTKGSMANSSKLMANSSHTEKDMELITGNVISGEISLQPDEVAGIEGIDVVLGTFTAPTGVYHTTVTIAYGENRTPYSLRVAPDVEAPVVAYTQTSQPEYAMTGFYSTADPTNLNNVTGAYGNYAHTSDNSGSIDAGNNFTLALGNTVSGTILATPESDYFRLEVFISDLEDPSGLYWTTVLTMQAGQNSISYTTPMLALDREVIVQYENSDNLNWASIGYYFDQYQSVTVLGEATSLSAEIDHSNVNLILTTPLGGDLNFDGLVDLEDAILGLQVLIDAPLGEEVFVTGDVDGDNIIGLPEVISILNQQVIGQE